MSSNAATLAGLVVTKLNATTFSQSFTATAKKYPLFKRDETTALEVVAIIGPETWTKLTRGGVCEVLFNVPLVIRQPVSDPEGEIDDLLELIDEIKHELISSTLGNFTPVGITQLEPYSLEVNETEGLFQSFVTIQYKGLI